MGFIDKLNEQIGYEFAASQQYVAIAVHYDVETLPRLAAVFYQQAIEERNHAMMLVQYLLDVGGRGGEHPGGGGAEDRFRRHRRASGTRARPGEAREPADLCPGGRRAGGG